MNAHTHSPFFILLLKQLRFDVKSHASLVRLARQVRLHHHVRFRAVANRKLLRQIHRALAVVHRARPGVGVLQTNRVRQTPRTSPDDALNRTVHV